MGSTIPPMGGRSRPARRHCGPPEPLMTPTRGALVRLLAAGCALLAPGLARPALAGDAKSLPNLTFSARLEPAEVGPGGAGVVILDVKVLPHVHVYADAKTFKVTPYPAAGVTYAKPVLSPPTSWKDPTDPDPNPEAFDVWFDKIEIRIPFKLAADAVLPLKVGADVKWSCCNEEICFPPEATKAPVLAEVKAPAGLPPPAPVAGA